MIRETNTAEIQTRQVMLNSGNTLMLFVNLKDNLVVLDVIAKDETGGHEILRQCIDEKALLSHLEVEFDETPPGDTCLMPGRKSLEAYRLEHGLKMVV